MVSQKYQVDLAFFGPEDEAYEAITRFEDVLQLIEKISERYKRDEIIDFEEDDDDDAGQIDEEHEDGKDTVVGKDDDEDWDDFELSGGAE